MPDIEGSAHQDAWSCVAPTISPPFVGYENELNVARHFARVARQRPRFAFLFGFPGTGKSSFCRKLCWDLSQTGVPSSLVTIECLRLATMHPEQVREILPDIARHIASEDPAKLQIILLDEIDCIAPHAPARTTTASWAVWLLKWIRDRQLPAFVACATNWPLETDEAIQSEVNQNIYCCPPDNTVLEAIALSAMEMDNSAAEQFVSNYRRVADKRGTVPMTRRLVLGIEDLRTVSGWKGMNSVELAEAVYTMAPPRSRDEYNRWVEMHKALIEAAEGVKRIVALRSIREVQHDK